MGYNPLAPVAAPASNSPAGPAPFVASGPLAGVQPLALKQPAKPAEPAAPPKPDLFADFNPLKS
jgi:hypothetical protein